MKQKISLSDKFTYRKLIRFVLPSIIMLVFTSIYSMVDGLFVSNFVGKTAFAALNLIYPLLMAFGSLGFMIGTGGSALVAKTLGEGDREKANRYFTMLVSSTVVIGVVITAIGMAIIRPIVIGMGATEDMIDSCLLYGRIMLGSITMFILGNVFQSFFITAERPKLGLAVMVVAGLINIALDALFVVGFQWGLAGAAAATAVSQTVSAVIPIVYFAYRNSSLLRFSKTRFYGRAFVRACFNGSSELLSNVSASLVNILYNFQLMRLVGEDGVAAYGFIMYVSFLFAALYFGYSIGSAPIIGFHYGAGNHDELKSLFRKSMTLVCGSAVILTAGAIGLSAPLSKLFVGYDAGLYELSVHGFRMYSISFLFSGFNAFTSAFFTALNDGLDSAIISFLRTLVFQIAAILILPLLLNLNGVWLAIVAAEGMAAGVSATLLLVRRRKYRFA